MLESVARTSRILVLQEASRSTGAAGHVLSLVARRGFELLDAPAALHAPPDTPVPFAPGARGRLPPLGRVHAPRAGGSACLLSRAWTRRRSPATTGWRSTASSSCSACSRSGRSTLYRQGRIPGSFYDGRGQEAVAAAAGLALAADDVVCPLNRELATHFAKGVTPAEAFRNFLGKGDSPTRGRDGNMHFGVPEHGVFPLVSMLGDLVPVTVGAALAFKRRGQPRVALTFLGEGAFSVGDTHEGLNLAGVWQVPAVFVLQRNQYAYSTPTDGEMLNTQLAERVYGGWSIPCEQVDGTDALATYDAVRAAVERARARASAHSRSRR